MIAYHGKQETKDFYLERVRAHRVADELIKGKYWEKFGEVYKGCAVGCTLHSADHSAYETELGIPRVLARLEDRIFEGLPAPLHLEWPERFLSAIKPGANLGLVWGKFTVWLLSDPEYGTRRLCHELGKKATDTVVALYERQIAGETIERSDWQAASAAASAAGGAAYAAAYAASAAAGGDAAAGDAAGDAASAAASAAGGAAYAAAYAADDAACYARGKHCARMADELIDLLGEAK